MCSTWLDLVGGGVAIEVYSDFADSVAHIGLLVLHKAS